MTAHNERWLGEPGLATDRGVARLWDPRVWGTFVGAAGEAVFVLADRGRLGHWWSVFRGLERSMAALGVIGLVAGWLWTATAAPAAAVIAGLVMLTFMAADALASGGLRQMQ